MLKLKYITALLLLIVFVLAPWFAAGTTDLLDPAITRIWAPGENGDRFVCTASYIYPRISSTAAWIVSAGHCVVGVYAKRNADVTTSGVINWRAVLDNKSPVLANPNVDIALGTVPDVRPGETTEHKLLWVNDTAPTDGHVYIHGFPKGVERVSIGMVVPPQYAKEFSLVVQTPPYGEFARMTVAELAPGSRLLLVPRGEIDGGSSGSPVLNEAGRLVGIVWGLISKNNSPFAQDIQGPGVNGNDIVLFTPVERLNALMKLLGVGEAPGG